MNIAIIGTRGIPNFYGGFEQFAGYLAKGLVARGHEVTVYNSHSHPYQLPDWNGVKLVYRRDPEDNWGTAGQFVYDLNCIRHARRQSYDIILQLGYTSSSVWGWLLPRKKSVVTTNMDGLEWKRTKYAKSVRAFLKRAEYLGTVFSDHLISDSLVIQEYLIREYGVQSTYIPYGAIPFQEPDPEITFDYGLTRYGYNMLIARLEPENNIDTILEGVRQADNGQPFLVVGNHETSYGEYLKNKYAACKSIQFIGSLFDIGVLNSLRYYCNLYFHGHSVGGTNPSLLEAMASQSLICAHRNEFNSTILGEDALYFSGSDEVAAYLNTVAKAIYAPFIERNLAKIKNTYGWDTIIDQYEDHFKRIYRPKSQSQEFERKAGAGTPL